MLNSSNVYGVWAVQGASSIAYANWGVELFHWNAGISTAHSSWTSPNGIRNTRRAIPPDSRPKLTIARNGSQLVLRNLRATPGATVESSTNLKDWTSVGNLTNEIPVDSPSTTPRFYRLRTN